MQFHLLSEAGLRAIFAFTSNHDRFRFRLVCKAFCAVLNSDITQIRMENLDGPLLVVILERFPNLQSLILQKCAMKEQHLQMVAQLCPMLRTIHFRSCRASFSQTAIMTFAKFCRDLFALSLDDVSPMRAEAFEAMVNFLQLRSISFRNTILPPVMNLPIPSLTCLKVPFVNFDDSGLAYIAKTCPQLRELDLRRCDITDSGIAVLARGCRMLHTIDLSQCNLTFKGFDVLVRYCHSLTDVSINGCEGMSDDCLSVMVSFLKPLRVLNAAETRFSVQALGYICMSCVRLQHLSVAYAKNRGDTLLNALAHCAELSYLDIRGWPVSLNGIKQLSRACRVLQTLKCEDALSLDYIASRKLVRALVNIREFSCVSSNIRDRNIAELADQCPHLTSLTLSDCPALTSACCDSIARDCTALTKLNLMRLPIDDAALGALSTMPFQQLRKFYFGSADMTDRVSDAALAKFVLSSPQLRTLECEYVASFGLAAMQALTTHTPRLRRLRVAYSWALNDACLALVAQAQLPNLRKLMFTHCDQLTDAGAEVLAQCAAVGKSLTVVLVDCGNVTPDVADALKHKKAPSLEE